MNVGTWIVDNEKDKRREKGEMEESGSGQNGKGMEGGDYGGRKEWRKERMEGMEEGGNGGRKKWRKEGMVEGENGRREWKKQGSEGKKK